MCIIAIKEAGVAMPDLQTLNNMWENNPDGAGYMYPKDGMVHIRKGFMEFEDLKNDLDKLAKAIDIKSTPIIMHFRIGTHGVRRNPANTHPFPVSKRRDELKALRFETKIGVAHNGIISSMEHDPDISDTMMYTLKVLAPMKSGNRKFYKNKHLLNLVENTIEGSRMCFMDGEGYISRVGDWTEDKDTGMIYSNGTYAYSLWGGYFPKRKKSNKDMWTSYLGSPIGDLMFEENAEPNCTAPENIDGDWDVMRDGIYFKKLTGLNYWLLLSDDSEMTAEDYADYIGYSIYVDEFGLVYAHIPGEGMMECDEVWEVVDLAGNHVAAIPSERETVNC